MMPVDALDAPLTAGSVVIADLHLDPSGGERVDAFCSWLAGVETPMLIILGDLFDVWVGPAQARMAGARRVFEALAARAGQLALVPGNRDFLLSEDFESGTGGRVYATGFVAGFEGASQRALFVHGDELCTLDRGYQRLKRVLRSPLMRWVAPRLPLSVARWAARRIRQASRQAVPRKLDAEKEMQAAACTELATASAADIVICGHAHLFRDEQLADGGPRWIVLDAWEGARDALCVTGGELAPTRAAELLVAGPAAGDPRNLG